MGTMDATPQQINSYNEMMGNMTDHTPDTFMERKVNDAKSDLDITMKNAADDRSYYGDRAKSFRYTRPNAKEGY